MFIIFCLIIRTAYQGVLFDYMNSDMRKPRAKTIDEVFEKKFTIIGHNSNLGHAFVKSLSSDKKDKVQLNAINIDFYHETISEILKENQPKIAIITEEHLEMVLMGVFKIKPHRVEGNVFSISVGLGMNKNHFMYDSVEEVMRIALASGIFNEHLNYFRWRIGHTRFSMSSVCDKKALTLDNLRYGFNIWLIACGFAIFIFFLEIVVCKISKKIQKLKRLNKKMEVQNNNSNDLQKIRQIKLLKNKLEFRKSQKSLKNSSTNDIDVKFIKVTGSRTEIDEYIEMKMLKYNNENEKFKNVNTNVNNDSKEETNQSTNMKILSKKIKNNYLI
ncbi:hypothetical protein PVAND_016647 [Polypedilum vanderplanki]|nr:hypothetical protein PVAND_016647 [Polypedilum vanderplanki]